MSSPLTRLQARIAGQLARERMGERFAAQVNYEATPVAGTGLARVDGQLVTSTVGEETSAGDVVAMANVGRPAAAIYSPQGGAAVVIAAAATSEVGGSGVTVHAQLSGLSADDHEHYLNIERGDARYYTEPEEDAWRAAHIALPDVHHKHATVAAPLSIDGNQYISLVYNSTLIKDGANKLGVNLGYNFAWTNSHNWAYNTTLQSAGVVIPPGISEGIGWKLDTPSNGNATLTIPNIYVGNLHAQAFIADVARADVGEEVWTRSRAQLYHDFTVPGINATATMIVEVPPGIDGAMMHLFGDNHYVRLRIFDTTKGLTIANAWGKVTYVSYSQREAAVEGTLGPPVVIGSPGQPARQTYTFQMLSGNAGATLPAGAVVLGYGLPGDAVVQLTTIADGAPYTAYYRWGIDLNTGEVLPNAVPWNEVGQPANWQLLTRIGNVEGQADSAFGGVLHGAGLYTQNAYLHGKIHLVGDDTVSGNGLFATGSKLGFRSGDTWKTYLDNTGSFYFTAAPVIPADGDTMIGYFPEGDDRVLGGKVYQSGTWRKTWWTDDATGIMYAGPSGEVMLHEYGLSMTAYKGTEIAPTYNTKAVGFFADKDAAKANANLARARIWGGYNVDKEAIGTFNEVRSMLQLEIGIDNDGVIASNNRPFLSMRYVPREADLGMSKQLNVGGFNYVFYDLVPEGIHPSQFVVNAKQSTFLNVAAVDELRPNGGPKRIGAPTYQFEAVYAKTVYADTIIAPSFTGQNTVGCELRHDDYWFPGTGNYEVWGELMAWNVVRDDAGFYNGANPKRITADSTGWYRISYSVDYYQYEHFLFVRVFAANGSSWYDTLFAQSVSNHASAAGDVYLQVGQYIELWQTALNGDVAHNKARFVMVRTGTNGLPGQQSIWNAEPQIYIRSNNPATTQVRIENANGNVGAVMDLSVEGDIIVGGKVDSVDLYAFWQEWDTLRRNPDPYPQYVLKPVANSTFSTKDALNDAIAKGSLGGGGGTTVHNLLTGLTDGDPHTQYVGVDYTRTIIAQHTFNPSGPRAPFLLGPNASGQAVVGFNADLLDGHHWDELTSTPQQLLAALLQVDGAGSGLDADLLDGWSSYDFARSSIIVGAGAGLTGGGPLTGSLTLAVGAGEGITVTEDTVALASSVAGNGLAYSAGVLAVNVASGIEIVSDNVQLASTTAGAGLTYTAGRLDVGAGIGILANANDVAVDTGANFTWTGIHTFQSTVSARHILPELTDTYDIGSSTLWWRQQYVSQINAAIFAVQTINLYDGWMMVPKDAGKLPAVAHGQLQINFGKPMTPGDFLVIRNRRSDGTTAVEYMQIGTLVSGTTYNVTRDKAGTGATYNWPVDTSYALLGQAGDGRVEINSYDTPRISVITQGASYNVQTETVRIGDINGMPGVTQQKWGIYIGTASQYLKWDGTSLTIAGDGSGVTNIAGGNIQTGTITGAQLNLSSYLAINSNTFGSDGIQLQYNGGNPRAYIGDGANRYFKFDGTTVTWKAANAELDASGNLIATNATLSGAITATSGSISGTLSIGASGKITAGNVTLSAAGISGLAGIGGTDTSSSWRFLDSAGVQVGILSATVPFTGNSGTTVTLESYAPSPATSTTLTLSARITGAQNYINIYPNKILFVTDILNVYTASGEKTVWHSGNLSLSSFLRSDTSTGFQGGVLTVTVPGSQSGGYNGQINTLQIFQSNAGFDAMMTFHVGGDYAVHFGLDGNTNDLFVGGWSMGSGYKYRIFHAGNIGKSGDWWGHVAYVGSDGVTEIGKYLDFHELDTDTSDNSVRLTGSAGVLSCNGQVSASSFYTLGQANVGQLDVYSAGHFVGSFNAQGIAGNAYGYINLNYTGTRRGYLLWSAGGVALTCDTGYALQVSSGANANTTVWSQAGTRMATASGYVDVGPQNTSYCHFQTDRPQFYFDHTIVINGNLTSYSADFTLSRAGTSRMTFYTWGTYVNQNLTIEDVFAITNIQSAVNNPASGVKLFLIVSGGVTYLQARFANGTTRNLANS